MPAKLHLGLPARYFCVLAICMLVNTESHGQRLTYSTLDSLQDEDFSNNDLLILPFYGFSHHLYSIRFRDTVIIIGKGICKRNYSARHVFRNIRPVMITEEKIADAPSQVLKMHKPFLRINGNVHYDFLYRSYIDTPFSQNDFQQHTVQTSLSITVKDKYPLKVNLSNRMSNSPYFRNFMDLNVRFDKNTFVQQAKQQLLDKIAAANLNRPDLTAAEAALKKAVDQFNKLKVALNNPDVLQRMVEEKERQYLKELHANRKQPNAGLGDINTDVLDSRKLYKMAGTLNVPVKEPKTDSSYTKYLERRKKDLDSLQQKIHTLQSRADSIKNKLNNKLATARRKIYKATHPGELRQIAVENGVSTEKKEGMESFLSHVKSIGIGRSVVNYSELTAWNVALTGLNIEYNNGIYAALSAGRIDYGFRDFLGKNTRKKGQNFVLGRVGWGNIDNKALILSAFAGKKYNYGSIVADSINDHINVVGYSVEGILKKDENTGLSIELAKTSRPVTGNVTTNGGTKPLFAFSDNANLGVSIKAQTLFEKTNTRINGFYRKTGQEFQSFSLFTLNTNQTAWLVNIDQPFWKNKIGVVASLRRNDFTNPFSEKTFKTSTIFKSMQVTVRIPLWPVVSAGYYPGTQLYIVDRERLRENAYYILNGSLVHNYKAGGIRMVSSLLYNKYSSKGTDTGFISYKGISYMASHNFIFQKLQLQGMYMYTNQEQMQYYTLDAGGDYLFSSMLRAGGSMRYNKIAGGSTSLGSRAYINIEVKKLGSLQLQYDKSYLPTIWQTLYPIETGRLSWYKFF